MRAFLGLFLLAFSVSASAQIQLVQIAGNLNRPVDIVNAGDGSGRLFIVLQPGEILIYDGTGILTRPFLNIRTSVRCCGEEGLLSLAFHPNYEENGFFYVYYVNGSGDLVLARYRASPRGDVALRDSRKILLTIPHPQFGNHNGGKLVFDEDGFLYLSVGDGGSSGDPNNNGQNLGTLLGKILRIDVNDKKRYAIPSSNPFANQVRVRKEIWAYGLRNPWRISFDREQGDLYIADVGQNLWEEISYQPTGSPGGRNYGWRRMEGTHCFNPSSNCDTGNLELPVAEYSHTDGCSVTGGFVYRGSSIPSLIGTYLYADYCEGTMWGLKRVSGNWTNTELLSSGLNISTFGEDENGELYLAHHSTSGAIYRIVSQ